MGGWVKVLWAVALVAGAAAIGGFAGSGSDQASRNVISDGWPPCSVLTPSAGVTYSDEVTVWTRGSEVGFDRETRVSVPSHIWEVAALRSPSADRNTRYEASRCLRVGGPSANGRLAVAIDRRRAVITSKEVVFGSSWPVLCGPDLTLRQEVDRFQLVYRPCPDERRPLSHVPTTITVVPNGRRVEPSRAPTDEDGDALRWRMGRRSWQFDVVVDVPLSGLERVVNWRAPTVEPPTVDSHLDVEIFVGSWVSWAERLLVLALVALLGRRPKQSVRQAFGPVIALNLVTLAPTIAVYGMIPDSHLAEAAVVTAAILGAAAALAEPWWLRVVLGASTIGAGILAVECFFPLLGLSSESNAFALVLLLLGALGLTSMASALVRSLAAVSAIVPGEHRAAARRWITLATVAVLGFGTAFVAVVAIRNGMDEQQHGLARAASFAVRSACYIVAPLIAVAAAADVSRAVVGRWSADAPPARLTVLLVAAWAILAAPPPLHLRNTSIPLGWMAAVVVITLLVRSRPPDVPLTSTVAEADLEQRSVARALLAHGPRGRWQANVRTCAAWGALLAAVPLLGGAGVILRELPGRIGGGGVPTYVMSELLAQVGFWVGTAALFGLLHRRLPGWNGIMKGTALGLAWVFAAFVVEVGRTWLDASTGREWLLPGAQLTLYLMVLGGVYDLLTIRAAGGDLALLQKAYGIERAADYTKVIVPIGVAVLTIAQQVSGGSGLDVVGSVLENLPSIVPPSAGG